MGKKNKDIKVFVEIKESKGRHLGVIDKFSGSPESVSRILHDKYVGKKGDFFVWLAEPFNVIDREFNKKK